MFIFTKEKKPLWFCVHIDTVNKVWRSHSPQTVTMKYSIYLHDKSINSFAF